jgi:hypothetical protein
LKVCQDEKLDAYIPDIHYRKRDPRFAEQERFKDGVQKDSDPNAKSRFTPQTLSLMRANRFISVPMEKN